MKTEGEKDIVITMAMIIANVDDNSNKNLIALDINTHFPSTDCQTVTCHVYVCVKNEKRRCTNMMKRRT